MKKVRMIKFNIKYSLYRIIAFAKLVLSFSNNKKIDRGAKAYVFSCPDHGNAGDIAIEKSEKKFLEMYFSEVDCINVRTFLANLSRIFKNISKNDIVCVQGGGSFGGLYRQADLERLIIFRIFKNNKIISFPQSVCFVNDNFKRKYIAILKKRDNIYLYFRDKDSYELAIKTFPFMKERIMLVPDIVMYLKDGNSEKNKMNRKYITVTLRDDKEGAMDQTMKSDIMSRLKSCSKYEVKIKDTYQNIFGNISKKEQVLDEVLSIYRSSRVVITDRLHGMILSYITNTPCIAVSNNNGKVESEYNTWLKKCKYISFLEEYDVDMIMQEINRLLKSITNKDFDYDLRNDFSKLEENM